MKNRICGMEFSVVKKLFYLTIAFAFAFCFVTEPVFAVTIAKLQEPIKELKKELFGGWMMAVKIISAAVGLIISIFRLNLMPFGIGAGLSVGIHFIDKWLGDGADGALI